MADKTFKLLESLHGKEASVNSATQIRAGVIRPEIIVPLSNELENVSQDKIESGKLKVGSNIRLIRQPNFGKLAKVVELVEEGQKIGTGAKVRVVKVALDNGKIIVVPRANIELVEE